MPEIEFDDPDALSNLMPSRQFPVEEPPSAFEKLLGTSTMSRSTVYMLFAVVCGMLTLSVIFIIKALNY